MGFPRRDPERLAVALQNTHRILWIKCIKQTRYARVGELVGFARATSDGVFSATIWDVAVAPVWQRSGLGRALMERLTKQLVEDGISTITLYAEPQVRTMTGLPVFYAGIALRRVCCVCLAKCDHLGCGSGACVAAGRAGAGVDGAADQAAGGGWHFYHRPICRAAGKHCQCVRHPGGVMVQPHSVFLVKYGNLAGGTCAC